MLRLRDELLHGSHTPLFIPCSAVSRVVTDLSDEDAEAIIEWQKEHSRAETQRRRERQTAANGMDPARAVDVEISNRRSSVSLYFRIPHSAFRI